MVFVNANNNHAGLFIPIPYETASPHGVGSATCIKQVQYTRQHALPRGQLSAPYYCINVLKQCYDCKPLTAAQQRPKSCPDSSQTQLQATTPAAKCSLPLPTWAKPFMCKVRAAPHGMSVEAQQKQPALLTGRIAGLLIHRCRITNL